MSSDDLRRQEAIDRNADEGLPPGPHSHHIWAAWRDERREIVNLILTGARDEEGVLDAPATRKRIVEAIEARRP